MSSEVVIAVREVSKCYRLFKKPHHRLLQMFSPRSRIYHEDYWALRDVSFDVGCGETVGILGRNGAGKSTLLQVITGILAPTSGEVKVSGKISALLELGSGFNPDFSGIENVFLNGALLGMSHTEIEKRLDTILAFADIGDFVHHPVKTYSSGMMMRLAFAVAVNATPRLLIIDEALSVGDIRFQNKCMRRLTEFRKSGSSILFVSHSPGLMEAFCDRVVWLEQGRVHAIGKPAGLVRDYVNLMTHGVEGLWRDEVSPAKKEHNVLPESWSWIPMTSSHNRRREGGDLIEAVRVRADGESAPHQLRPRAYRMEIEAKLSFDADLDRPLLGVGLFNELNEPVIHFNSHNVSKNLAPVKAGSKGRWRVEFEMPALRPGNYLIALGVDDGLPGDSEIIYHVYDAWTFRVALPENPSEYQGGYIQMGNPLMELLVNEGTPDALPS